MELIVLAKILIVLLLVWTFYGKQIKEWYDDRNNPRVSELKESDCIPRYGLVFEYTYEGNGVCKLQATSKGYNKRATIVIDNILQIELDKDGTNYYMLNMGEQHIAENTGLPYLYREGRYMELNEFYTNLINAEVDKLDECCDVFH